MIFNYKSIFLALSRSLTALPRRRERSMLRKMLRGYRFLKSSNCLNTLEDAVQNLREYELIIPTYKFSKVLWGAGFDSAELITRQKLSIKYPDLNRALLIAASSPNGLVSAAIPKAWRVKLEQLGYSVDNTKCSIYWALELAKYCIHGVLKAFFLFGETVYIQHPTCKCGDEYIYFCDLRRNNLPANNQDNKSYCLINWYAQWNGRNHCIKNLRHGVPRTNLSSKDIFSITFQKNPIPPLLDFSQKVSYVYWLFKAFYACLVSVFVGSWWNLIILPEAVTAISVRLQFPSLLAKEYWFHNSRFYPPLWTYELAAKCSKSIYYFYSTNVEPFGRKDGSRPFVTPYSLMNWPHYLVWDKSFSSFIRKTQRSNSSMRVSGPLWFSDCASVYKCSKLPIISVFHVTPHRCSSYSRLGQATDYYVPETVIAFLHQILLCATQLGLMMVIKEKRNIGRTAHPFYQAYLNRIKDEPNVDIVDPDMSACKVIKKSQGCISLPFTSTAHIAHGEGVKSVYFDPTSSLLLNDAAARGLAIINDRDSLLEWMKTLILSRS
jgi:polysaccharide biosynthesis PFTS motif protein